jgi:hypothetical protein
MNTIKSNNTSPDGTRHFDTGHLNRQLKSEFPPQATMREGVLSRAVAAIASVIPPTTPEVNSDKWGVYEDTSAQSQQRRSDIDDRMADLRAKQVNQAPEPERTAAAQPAYIQNFADKAPQSWADREVIDDHMAEAARVAAERESTPQHANPLYTNLAETPDSSNGAASAAQEIAPVASQPQIVSAPEAVQRISAAGDTNQAQLDDAYAKLAAIYDVTRDKELIDAVPVPDTIASFAPYEPMTEGYGNRSQYVDAA